MKFTAAIAVIGAVSGVQFAEGDTTPTWGLRSITDHREEAQTQIGFANYATDAANARPPLRSHVQTNVNGSESSSSDSDDDEEDLMLAGKPDRFMNADSDDLFMRSVLDNYSIEGKNKDKSPNGVFTVNEVNGRALAKEVLGTHKSLVGAPFEAYMDSFWTKAWGHFDVNKTGSIPILYAPQLMRFLLSDQYVQL